MKSIHKKFVNLLLSIIFLELTINFVKFNGKFLIILIEIILLMSIYKKYNASSIKYDTYLFKKFIVVLYIMLIYLIIFNIVSIAFSLISLIVFYNIIQKILKNNSNLENSLDYIPSNVEIKCLNCGEVISDLSVKECPKCGSLLPQINIETLNNKANIVGYSNFDPIYTSTEADVVKEFIRKEIINSGLDINTKLISLENYRKKIILSIIFSILLFVYISLIFFHFPIYTYIIGIIILLIFRKFKVKTDILDDLYKRVQLRPNEKISNIVMDYKTSFVENKFGKYRFIMIMSAIVLPLIIFYNPRIMYEKNNNGYSVRFYTFGLTNFTKAEIPSTYKGKTVTSLRGNTFSNMPFLKEVILPDTIIEIRGQAFKNDIKLVKVNIPSKLDYLGGGAFYNCTSITEIELPDTLIYLGGESFKNAKSLSSIKLSNNLKEIRGNTFENCVSLTSIEIPDSVTRIGGHAFYNNKSLTSVIISENSQLTEIGSSAFRLCNNLYKITIPSGIYVNSRAFKESPTTINYY